MKTKMAKKKENTENVEAKMSKDGENAETREKFQEKLKELLALAKKK